MHYVDYKFIKLLGSFLTRFKDLGNDVFTFRCPICGDSKKKESKTRGYIFGHDKPRFLCHNCGASSSLLSFIRHIDEGLYLQYRLEKFKKGPKPKNEFNDNIFATPKIETRLAQNEELFGAVKLSSPTADPIITEYAFQTRKIPESFNISLYSTPNVDELVKETKLYTDRQVPKLPALVIPFFDEDRSLDWLQCRVMHPSFRYITLNVSGNEHAPKVWGIEYIDWEKPVYITEGPIDAMCLRNALAIAGVANTKTIRWIQEQAKSKIIFCYDNDYSKNLEVRNQLLKRMTEGFGVVVYDKWFKWKDLNEAIVSGIHIDALNNYIEDRTFFGIKARLNISASKERPFYGEKNKSSTTIRRILS